MKKLFLISVMILLVAGLIFGSCAAPTTAPAPAPTPTSAPVPVSKPTQAPTPAVAPAKPIELRFSYPTPTSDLMATDIHIPWGKMIEERTAAIGKPVKIVFYGGGALGKAADHPNMILGGVCDIGANWATYTNPGLFPLNDVMILPMMFFSAVDLGMANQELYDTLPEFRDEFEGMKLLYFHGSGTSNMVTRPKQVKVLEDFKGMKCTAEGKIKSDTISALGGVPVSIPTPEAYTSLERGLLDAGILGWNGIYHVFKWHEVTEYRTVFPQPLLTSPLVCAMNLNSYKSLLPEVQKIIDECSGAYWTTHAAEINNANDAAAYKEMVEYDKKIGKPEHYVMPKDEFQRWQEAVKPIYEKWINEMEAKGLPGRSIYEDVQRLIDKYSK